MPRQTTVEKIVQRFAVGLEQGQTVGIGDFVRIRPRHVMTHDNTAPVLTKFQGIGASRVLDPSQPVFCLDHDVQNRSTANLAKYSRIEAFAASQGIAFFPAGRGIGHQIMMEEGFCRPGALVVGSDSHSNLYGALGALGTPVVRTDAAALWASGETWWQVPVVSKVVFEGVLRPGVTAKDLILTLIGKLSGGEFLNHAVEFHGPGLANLGMEPRMTIANMTTEWGVLAGVFPYDEVTAAYLRERARFLAERGDPVPRLTLEDVDSFQGLWDELRPDPDAVYGNVVMVDLGKIRPHVAGPNAVDCLVPLEAIQARRVPIHKAYLLSCVNGRLEDIVQAAEVLEGKRVAPGVEFYLAAASSEIEKEAVRLGAWERLLKAGAIVLPAGCGPCIGLGRGTLEPGQVGISATNRNFRGRMGSREAECYLASPLVVAASAAAGFICGPTDPDLPVDVEPAVLLPGSTVGPASSVENDPVPILAGFPTRVVGRILYLPKDSLDTDGIYGKDWTYKELPPEEMGAVAMLNYDPKFQEIAREGDILVSGRSFGSGSSREQAATALKFRGIRLVVARSFSQTYKRNAFNNGFIVLECPGLVDRLEREAATHGLTALTNPMPGLLEIDFAASRLRYCGKEWPFAPLAPVAQELIVAGGVENLIRERPRSRS